MTPTLTHPGILTLRRLHVGEAVGEDIRAHAAICDVCQSKIRGFVEEQKHFERDISFDRFSAGVERAAREPKTAKAPRRWIAVAGLALAASLAIGVAAQVFRSGNTSRVKGGDSVEVVIAGAGGQRVASMNSPEALAAGERIRIGVSGLDRYVLAMSIDEHGVISRLYDDRGHSLSLPFGGGTRYLPDSFELTDQGLEHVVVVVSEEPIETRVVSSALSKSFEAAGDKVLEMKDLAVPGAQFHRTFLKP